jgi:small subunit ribosomal protein S15
LNKKDHSSRRGLLTLVARRRSLLNYVKNNSEEVYQGLVEQLGLRK